MAQNVDVNKIKMQRKNASPRRKKGRRRKGGVGGDNADGDGGHGEKIRKHIESRSFSDTKEITRHFLKSLGEELYERIVHMFQIDFDLFGYISVPFNEL